MDRRDERELQWWRHFATKIEPGSDMPRVNSALLGHRFQVVCTTKDGEEDWND